MSSAVTPGAPAEQLRLGGESGRDGEAFGIGPASAAVRHDAGVVCGDFGVAVEAVHHVRANVLRERG